MIDWEKINDSTWQAITDSGYYADIIFYYPFYQIIIYRDDIMVAKYTADTLDRAKQLANDYILYHA